jgi:hypothetical protein
MAAKLIRHTKVTDELGNTVEIRLWEVPPANDKPHGFKYSLVYIVNGHRVIGYDNGEQQGDHRHYGDMQEEYKFTGIRQLAADFLADVNRYKERNQ